MRDFYDYSLLKHNTFGIDAKCKRFIEFCSEDELCSVLPLLNDDLVLLLGAGSNLLLMGDYQGTVLHSAIKGKEILRENADTVWLRCGSGETWDDVVAYVIGQGWYGAENLSLIPGEVGASAVQNIGAYGMEVKDLIEQVETVELSTGNRMIFMNEECCYAYRQSRFKQDWRGKYVITRVVYRFHKGGFVPRMDYGNIRSVLAEKGIGQPTAKELREAIIEIRTRKLPDPKVQGNAGSFFMNPVVTKDKFNELVAQYPDIPHYMVDDGLEKIPAGWMIEQCGWKGKTLGRAGVHDRQALVLVNCGGATGQEICHLCKTIQQDVKTRFGIEIKPEVNIVG